MPPKIPPNPPEPEPELCVRSVFFSVKNETMDTLLLVAQPIAACILSVSDSRLSMKTSNCSCVMPYTLSSGFTYEHPEKTKATAQSSAHTEIEIVFSIFFAFMVSKLYSVLL